MAEAAAGRRFEGRVALISGSSRGIGRALALGLARGGASVVVNYKRNADLAAEVVEAVEAAGGQAISVQADVEQPEGVEALFDAAAQRFERVDVFVSNAAASAFKNILDVTVNNLDRTFDLNVRAFVLGAQRAVRLMPDGGRILALTSYGSLRAYPTYANLGAAKAAIEAWVRYMAAEFGPRGITVNAVSGGIIETDSSAFFYRVPGIPPVEEVLAAVPLRRMGTAQEMADAALFLLSPEAAYITGHVLAVDGGLTVVAPPFHAQSGPPINDA
ncbi:MAG TPA: SDR family oxidoreductase [Candidatus Limnocylindrales bacterium]|jgi:enoyl-[acyl-carrier protein] reductase III|nr:SDR family oxidoreductase [Candidatus Limnocylindrales bacterium]